MARNDYPIAEECEDPIAYAERQLEDARAKLRRLREVMITIANYSDAAAHASRLAENAPSETGRDAAYTDMTSKIRNALSRGDVCP
jgi:hypothetical protein